MKRKSVYRDDGWVLGVCSSCGRTNYVEPHGTTAECRCAPMEQTEHAPVPQDDRIEGVAGPWIWTKPDGRLPGRRRDKQVPVEGLAKGEESAGTELVFEESDRCAVCEATWDDQVEFLVEKMAQDADWRKEVAVGFLTNISEPHLALTEMGFAEWWDERKRRRIANGSTGM